MSIMDFFSQKPQAQQQQQPQGQQQQPQNGQGSQGPNMPQNGNPMGQGGSQGQNPQGQGNNPNAGTQPNSNPMDAYSKLWENPSNESNTPPSFSIDPKIMDQVVGSQDFMKGVDPALMQKATSGDVQALMEIMQSVGRNAYRSSIEHGGMLTDKFVGAREAYGSKNLPSMVRKELTTHALSDTPNFQHPVVKRQLTEIATRFQQQHPDAPPQEIARMAKKYVTDLVSAMTPESQTKQGQNPQTKEPTDWGSYFDEENSFTN